MAPFGPNRRVTVAVAPGASENVALGHVVTAASASDVVVRSTLEEPTTSVNTHAWPSTMTPGTYPETCSCPPSASVDVTTGDPAAGGRSEPLVGVAARLAADEGAPLREAEGVGGTTGDGDEDVVVSAPLCVRELVVGCGLVSS